MHKLLSVFVLSILFVGNAYCEIDILHITQSSASSCTGAMEIIAEGTAGPFSIVVLGIEDNGNTTIIESASNINGTYITSTPLCPGQYDIIITNAYGCSTTLTAEVIACGTIIIEEGNLNPSIHQPSACGAEDGDFHFNPGPIGGSGGYTYIWSNGATDLNIGYLGVGTYTLTITDSEGCTAVFSYEMPGPNVPELITEATDVQAACLSVANGFIGIGVYPNNSGPYDFVWSNGHTTVGDFLSSLENIAGGTYTVTITNQDGGCTSSETFTVTEVPDEGPFSISGQSANTCPNENTGSVNTTVSGGNPPYEIVWSNGMTGAVVTTLAAGSYSVTATDYCDRTQTASFSVGTFPTMTITLESISGCPETGIIDVSVAGGSPPYTFAWSNGQNTEDATNVDNGTIELVVTDSEGCTDLGSYDVQLGEVEVINEDPPCEGFDDGSVTLLISKPNNLDPSEIEIFLEGFPYPFDPPFYPAELLLTGLSSETDYTVDATIGNCDFSITFNLEAVPTDKEFLSESGICYYEESCDEVILGTYEELPTYDYNAATGGLFEGKCKLPVYCDGMKTRDIKIPKRKEKAGRYWVTLMAAESFINNSIVFGNLLNRYTTLGLEPCDVVKYCPTSFEIISSSHPLIFNGSGSGSHPTPNTSTGCFDVKCHSWLVSDYSVCPNTLNLLGIGGFDNELINCTPQQFRIFLIITDCIDS